MSPFAWLRLAAEALGLVKEAVPVVVDLAGLGGDDCPDTLRSAETLAARGQAAGAAAQASQAATSQAMRGGAGAVPRSRGTL